MHLGKCVCLDDRADSSENIIATSSHGTNIMIKRHKHTNY